SDALKLFKECGVQAVWQRDGAVGWPSQTECLKLRVCKPVNRVRWGSTNGMPVERVAAEHLGNITFVKKMLLIAGRVVTCICTSCWLVARLRAVLPRMDA